MFMEHKKPAEERQEDTEMSSPTSKYEPVVRKKTKCPFISTDI